LAGQIKEDLTATVSGNIVEKILYYAILFVVIGMFLASTITLFITAGTTLTTNVALVALKEMPYPSYVVCYKARCESGSGEDCSHYALPKPNPSADMGCTDKNFASFENKCVRVAHTSGTSPGTEPELTGGEAEFFKQLYTKGPSSSENCALVNFDGKLKVTPTSGALIMPFKYDAADIAKQTWTATTNSKSQTVSWTGVLFDPKKAEENLAGMMESIVLTQVHGLNAMNVIGWTYDLDIQRHKHLFWAAPDDLSDLPDIDNVTKIYNSHVSYIPFKQYYNHAGLSHHEATEADIYMMATSFVSRRIVTRKMSFMEIWSSIGGNWATSMLILAFFFKKVEGTNLFNCMLGSRRQKIVENILAAKAEKGKAAESGGASQV